MAKLPGVSDGMLAAIAKVTQTSPLVMSMDEAHKLLPGDFPSLNVGIRRLLPLLFFMFLCQCICDLFGCTWGIYFDCLVTNCD